MKTHALATRAIDLDQIEEVNGVPPPAGTESWSWSNRPVFARHQDGCFAAGTKNILFSAVYQGI
ncbi:hypothetical protein WN67_24155 [Mycolicibacterium obuense]|uniref:Uncharacterized protein n=2 Tax=Mycolicibacterium obuense TaxID=1807 RepID=A0A0M2JWX9_9MYCO|nr:hypothetical protein WN67_24155 [Mycolicibacterium obuense]